MRYVENGVREDFAKLTFKELNVPLCELDEEEWLEVVFGIKSSSSDVKKNPGGKSDTVSLQGSSTCGDASIDILELSARAEHCLQRAGVTTIGKLCAMSEEELSKLRNMGKKTVEEVKAKLRNFFSTINCSDSAIL